MYPRKRSNKKRVLIVSLLVMLVVDAAVGGWLLFTSPPEEATLPNMHAQNSTEVPESPTFDDVRNVATTEDVAIEEPDIELTIPVSWEVEQQEDQGVRITSPDFSYTTTNGETVEGNFRIYIREGAREQDGKYLGRGLASKQSQELTYTEPASGQRAKTSISFFGLDSADNFAYFFIAGNFSLEVGESLGAGYGQNDGAFIISGGYSSPDLIDDMATNIVPLDYFDQTNAYSQALDIIRSLRLL